MHYKNVFGDTFYQLLGVYALAIFLVALGLLGQYALHFQIAAVVVALFGLFVVWQREEVFSKKISLWVFVAAIVLIVALRAYLFLNHHAPLGYDTGLYRYVIEHGLENMDDWVITNAEPGFMYLMSFLSWFFSVDMLLSGGFIFFCGLLGVAIYLCTSVYFNRTAGVFAVLIFALSAVQYKVFWYVYYRNIIGITLMLMACYSLKKAERDLRYYWLFGLFGVFLGFMHRPTFYLFGLCFAVYTLVSPWKRGWYDKSLLVRHVIIGAVIVAFVALGYVGPYWPAVSYLFEPVLQGFVQPGESSGTFIDFFTFQFSTLFYLPLALLGWLYFVRRKDFSMLVLLGLISALIVYFQFFFFNRFIIFLDVACIVLAGVGFALVWGSKNRWAIAALLLLLASGAIFVVQEVADTEALVSTAELNMIGRLQNTPEGSYVMSTSSYYSPWLQGYSQRRVIAPGLFDYDSHSRAEWSEFWSTNDSAYVKDFMSSYSENKPLYVYIGPHQVDTVGKFTECFFVWQESAGGVIYEYVC